MELHIWMIETVKDEAWRQTVCLCMLNLTCEMLKSVEHHTGPAATVKCSSAHKKLQIFFGYQNIDQNNVQKQLLPYSLKQFKSSKCIWMSYRAVWGTVCGSPGYPLFYGIQTKLRMKKVKVSVNVMLLTCN